MQDFAETAFDFHFFPDDSHQHVNADGNPDLGLYRIFGGPEERLDAKVLFDPFEEQFHLPTAFVELCDGQRRKVEIVGQKDIALFVYGIVEADSPECIGIFFGWFVTPEDYRLIAANARCFVHGPVGSLAKIEVAFGTNNKERQALRESIQAAEIYVATVHDIEGARFQNQLVEDVDIVDFPLCDADKTRYIAAQVYQRVQFDGGLVFAKSRPGKQRKTKIDLITNDNQL